MSADSNHAVVAFPDGLPGFEHCHQFVFMSGQSADPFTIVQGLGPNAPAFVAVDPVHVVDGYRAELPENDLRRLDADAQTPLVWLALISPVGSETPTVNLRAPLVINPASLRGIQFINAESDYRFDHPLRAA